MSNDRTDKWVVIEVDGTARAETFDPAVKGFGELYRLIGAGCRTVEPVRLDPNIGLDMWLDEDGGNTGQPLNVAATAVARRFGFIWQGYVGVAVIAQTINEGEDSEALVGLDQDQLDSILLHVEMGGWNVT